VVDRDTGALKSALHVSDPLHKCSRSYFLIDNRWCRLFCRMQHSSHLWVRVHVHVRALVVPPCNSAC
jgi:hypothetical protein